MQRAFVKFEELYRIWVPSKSRKHIDVRLRVRKNT